MRDEQTARNDAEAIEYHCFYTWSATVEEQKLKREDNSHTLT